MNFSEVSTCNTVTEKEIRVAELQLKRQKRNFYNKSKMSEIFFLFLFLFSDAHKHFDGCVCARLCVCVCVCQPRMARRTSQPLSYSLWCHQYGDVSPNPDAGTCSKSSGTSCATSQQLMSQTHSEHQPRGQLCSQFVFYFYLDDEFLCVFFRQIFSVLFKHLKGQ